MTRCYPLDLEWVNWIAVKTTHSQVIPSQVRCSSTLFYNLFFFFFFLFCFTHQNFLLVILLYWDKRAANRWFTSQKSQSQSQSQSWISEFYFEFESSLQWSSHPVSECYASQCTPVQFRFTLVELRNIKYFKIIFHNHFSTQFKNSKFRHQILKDHKLWSFHLALQFTVLHFTDEILV